MEPVYQRLWRSGELKEKTQTAWDLLSSCTLCPKKCRVNRLKGEKGFCRQGDRVKVATALPHFGEEPPLSGTRGAGTIFFSGCALRCLYCQNFQISQEFLGEELDPEGLTSIFLDLQHQGCHNLDLVSPTPHLPFILSALERAVPKGFSLPIVYNTHGYLTETALDLLDGIVDIFLPDMKYGGSEKAGLFSQAEDYPKFNKAAVAKMFRQVGPLKLDNQGIAFRGLLVRHLILPENKSDSQEILRFLASISPGIPVSLMAQYRPCFKSQEVPELNRTLEAREYVEVVTLAEKLGFEEIYVQDLESPENYYPDFSREDPFAEKKLT
jgi:putative pyruvate formate lyase activating enzyme